MYTGYISTLALLTCIACLAQNFDHPKTREEQCLLNFVNDNFNLTSANNRGLTSYQKIREFYYNLAKPQLKGYISLVERCTDDLPSVAALIAASPSHSLFAKVMQANEEIYNLLSGTDPSRGSFTVFAPTDGVMQNENVVLDLRYHIVPKRLLTEHANPGRTYRTQSAPPLLSRDVLLGASPQVTTLSSGQTLSLSLTGQEITLNNQLPYELDTWKGSNQYAWNGVLHSIDG